MQLCMREKGEIFVRIGRFRIRAMLTNGQLQLPIVLVAYIRRNAWRLDYKFARLEKSCINL